jgi:hypothetical protein
MTKSKVDQLLGDEAGVERARQAAHDLLKTRPLPIGQPALETVV